MDKTKPNYKEIQQMMHGFGDCALPLTESAKLIESIVHQQMMLFIQNALDVAEIRGSKIITPEDLLFTVRRDHHLLQRLINYMGARDVTKPSSSIQTQNSNVDVVDLANDGEHSRKKMCIHFLQSINHSGEYDAICNGMLYDPVKVERVTRYDLITQNMSDARYREYCEARRASFCSRHRVGKFREWLQSEDYPNQEYSQHVLELLNFFAYETVAKLVDLALLVKRDEERANSGRHYIYAGRRRSSNRVYTESDKEHMATEEKPTLIGRPITVAELREAIRRYSSNDTPLTPFCKITIPLSCKRIIG